MPRIEVPGGHADLYEKHELTPRRQIPVRALMTRASDLYAKVLLARVVVSPTGETEETPGLPGEPLHLTQEEAELLEEIGYATAWAYLKGWTLPHPLPRTWQDFLDIPHEVATAIKEEVAKVNAGPSTAESFEPSKDTLQDGESFTGGSGTTSSGSGASATTTKSTRARKKS